MEGEVIIDWLLEGDVSIQYQVYRDLLGITKSELQEKISKEGWGAMFLSKRNSNGHWGQRFYQPKWISTHYTLLDLRNLSISRHNEKIKDTIAMVLADHKSPDGGILPIGEMHLSDMCINGMVLNYASYFHSPSHDLESIVDCLLNHRMEDGGFNCRLNRSGAKHSSLHTTISVLEGITEYYYSGYKYRIEELLKARNSSIEFMLLHQLFLSDRTGKIINNNFLKMPYPSRWKYDILRALDFLQYSKTPWDERMWPAMEVILSRRNKDGTWNLNAKHPGKIHFEMEKAGKASRINTLRSLRVLDFYKNSFMSKLDHFT